MKIDKTTKIQIVIVAFLVMIIAAMYLNTLETRSVPYDESYQEPVYRTEYYQDPVYKTEYYMEKVPYKDTVSNSRSLKNSIRQIECHGNAHHWYGDETGHAIYEVINTDTIGGDFTVSIKMILSDEQPSGNQMTKYISAGGYAFFEYKLYIPESVTCEGNVISALSTETNVVTKYNDVQRSKQVIDRYETKSNQVIDHYDTKYRTLYNDVTKTKYEWFMSP